jgi:DNA-directed RNA polymerase subunit RPC12/RpoP
MENDLLDAIKHRINAGYRKGARLELTALLKSDPDDADAWALLAILLQDPVEQVECYRQILRINPDDRQAAAWLDALSRDLPEASQQEGPPTPDQWTLRCAQCGGVTEVRFVGELRDKRAFCPHCGSQIDLPDSYQRVEQRREREELPGGGSRTVESVRIETRSDGPPSEGPVAETGRIGQVLQDLDLPDADDEARHQLGEQGMDGGLGERPVHASETGAEDRGLVDRVLRRVRGQSLSGIDDPAALDEVEGTPQPGRLSPEDILRLAGGPLPPEERRKCPRCGAIVSRSESKCPWCSAHLSGAEDR